MAGMPARSRSWRSRRSGGGARQADKGMPRVELVEFVLFSEDVAQIFRDVLDS